MPGCGKNADKDKLPDDITIEVLVAIGPVRFGMSKGEIIKHFGQPDEISGKGTELSYVSSKGLSFTVPPNSACRKSNADQITGR